MQHRPASVAEEHPESVSSSKGHRIKEDQMFQKILNYF